MNARRLAAKALYRISGKLSRIRTYQRMYDWNGPGLDFTPGGRLWMPNGLSLRLLGVSQNLDWDHWDHWATRCHDGCRPSLCAECGGDVCRREAVTAR